MIRHHRTLREIAETTTLALTIGISIIVSLLDFSGTLDGIPWIGERIPALTLLFVGLTATYLALERRGTIEALVVKTALNHEQVLQEINISTKNIITALEGVELRRYLQMSDFYNHFMERLQRAKKLEYTYWGDWGNAASRLTGADLELMQRCNEVFRELRERKDVIVREIRVFPLGTPLYEKLEQNLRRNLPGYSVSCYAVPPSDMPRSVSFHILDDEELFLIGERMYLSVKHPDIVAFFADYYELSWSKGHILSKGTAVHEQALDTFKALLLQDTLQTQH